MSSPRELEIVRQLGRTMAAALGLQLDDPDPPVGPQHCPVRPPIGQRLIEFGQEVLIDELRDAVAVVVLRLVAMRQRIQQSQELAALPAGRDRRVRCPGPSLRKSGSSSGAAASPRGPNEVAAKGPSGLPTHCQARSRSRHTRQAVGQPARRADNPASCRRQRAGTASVRSMTLATGRGHKSCTPSGSPQTSSLNGTSGRTVRGQVERRPRPWISCRHASRRLQAGHRSGGGSSSLSVADPSGRYRHTHEPRAP